MDVVSYKCPNCSAGLGFNIESQSWDCAFCNSKFSLQDLENPKENDENTNKSENTSDNDFASFSCPSCGGSIITDKNTAATFCIYCHNPTVIASRLDREFRPERLIPFKLEKSTVAQKLLELCKKRPLLPSDFRSYAENGEVSGLYVPFWLFDADIDANITANGLNILTWSDSNYIYTKTDTFYVERVAKMSFNGLPADGSSKMDDALMEALEPFDYKQMVDFSMGYLSGHFAESYDVDGETAGKRALPRIRKGVEDAMRAQITGYTSVNVKELNSKPTNVKRTYVMLPIWILMSDYKGKKYTFAMNGQTGKISGKFPISTQRAIAWFSGISVLSMAIAALILGVS